MPILGRGWKLYRAKTISSGIHRTRSMLRIAQPLFDRILQESGFLPFPMKTRHGKNLARVYREPRPCRNSKSVERETTLMAVLLYKACSTICLILCSLQEGLTQCISCKPSNNPAIIGDSKHSTAHSAKSAPKYDASGYIFS